MDNDLQSCIACNLISNASLLPGPHCNTSTISAKHTTECRYDGGNYQGKDMAHMQENLANNMANQAKAHQGFKAHLARMALGALPRGGGDGDAIRMTILDLLRNNGIKARCLCACVSAAHLLVCMTILDLHRNNGVKVWESVRRSGRGMHLLI